MLDWVIIGGGVHGTYLSNVLVNQIDVGSDRVVVVDPFAEPLARWKHCTKNTGMTHLRSPVVHHLGLGPMDLLEFSRSSAGRKVADFRPPYDRPGLELFEVHTREIIEQGNLRALREQGRASALSRSERGGFQVETDRGVLEARQVVLATGSGEKLAWPSWAGELLEQGARVEHIFDQKFRAEDLKEGEEVIIVGLGISGAQLAQRLATRQSLGVTLLGRQGVKVHQFDSEPCWLGPKCQAPFRKVKDYKERRELINQARHRGSMPQDVALGLEQLTQWERVKLKNGEVDQARVLSEGRVELFLESGERLEATTIILATGFESPRVDQSWLGASIEELGLECSACGFPLVNQALQWAPGLWVSGPLAELELGPAARNIAGARMAGRRIAAASGQ